MKIDFISMSLLVGVSVVVYMMSPFLDGIISIVMAVGLSFLQASLLLDVLQK